jgi:hypothetical protein
MVEQTLLDFNRRDINLTESKVREVLPSYYLSEYPDLVQFLEYYYDWMDSDATHGFDRNIHDLYKLRDIPQTELTYLNRIFYEIGQDLISADYFSAPRFIAGLLANSYRIKGSLYSAEGFFRAFFGEQPQIEYPKNSLFVLNDSRIGPESLKVLQNGALYQVLSVLVKSGVPISEWRDLYKSFVHPAGFYLGGEVIIEASGDLSLNPMPDVLLDSNSGLLVIDETAGVAPTSLSSITLVYPDSLDTDSSEERLVTTTVREYQTLTIEQLNNLYNSIEELLDVNSPTFDDDSAVGDKAIKFSNTLETMDQDAFTGLYGADSPGY